MTREFMTGLDIISGKINHSRLEANLTRFGIG